MLLLMAKIYRDTGLRTVSIEEKKGPPTGTLRADGGIRANHLLAAW
jgi:hypothetical protein